MRFKKIVVATVVLAVIVFLMAGTLSIVGRLFLKWSPGTQRKPVGSPPPDMFPIVVITNGADPHLVYQKDLAKYIEKHPEATFLIPPAMTDKVLNRKLDAAAQEDNPGDPWYGTVKVRRIGPDHQELEVDGSSDDYQNAGWYDARAHQINPHFHQFYFGPGVGMSSCLPATGITLVLWAILLTTGVYLIRARKRPPAPPAGSRR